MKKKKKLLLITSLVLSISICVFGLISQNSANVYANKSFENKIIMNSETNKLHNHTGSTAYSGEANVTTAKGNDISITYTDLMGLASTWHVVKNGGGFYNGSPIHGLESISLSFKTNSKSFKIYWSDSKVFDGTNSQSFVSSTSEPTVFNFNNDFPTYLNFVNTSGSNLNISEVEIDYSCQNNYPTLSIQSNDNEMGTVSGPSGVIRTGEIVTIVASPKTGYKFVGWYDNDTLLTTNSSYSFIMGYDDLNYIARFIYQSYNFVVQTESIQKGSVVDISGTYNYLTSITVEATANEGYSFAGWYEGTSLVSSVNPYTFNMPHQSTVYTAKFLTNSYVLTLNNANPSAGNVSSSGSHLYGENVTIVAIANTGAVFAGWYDSDDNLVSSLSSYTFIMPHNNLTYVAKFEWISYTVTLTVDDSDMGVTTGSGSYIYNQEVTIKATPKEHFSFFGWYDGETLLSQESIYVFNMPNKDISYECCFVPNHNLYIYSDDETKGTVSFPEEWGEGLSVTINAFANTGYSLNYWYDDDLNEVSYEKSYTFMMPNNDVTLYASFEQGHKLLVKSNNESKGTASGTGVYLSGQEITVTASILNGYFEGWFYNNSFINKSNPYIFTMPNYDYTLEARFSDPLIADTINLAFTGVSGTSFKSWSDKTGTSGAVYAGQSAGGNESIQLRSSNSNSGVVTTTSGGLVKRITIVWNAATDNARVLDVYGKNTAYTQATELYDTTTQGTSLGSFAKSSSITTLDIDGNYEFIAFRSHSGHLYLNSIIIEWQGKDPSAPSVTITTEPCDFEIGDKGTFTAEKTNADEENILWSSSDPSVISVNETTGEYEALKLGVATITATLSTSGKTSSVHFGVTKTITVDEAVELTAALADGATSAYSVTIVGEISAIVARNIETGIGFYGVWLKSSSVDKAFEFYFAYAKPSNWDEVVVVGNKVTAKGNLMNYVKNDSHTYELINITDFELY